LIFFFFWFTLLLTVNKYIRVLQLALKVGVYQADVALIMASSILLPSRMEWGDTPALPAQLYSVDSRDEELICAP